MESTENGGLIPELPDEAEYPRELRERYELLERLSEKEHVRTLLAANRRALCCKMLFAGKPPL